MKVKIELSKSETLEQAEDLLYKALKSKKKSKEKSSHAEKFQSPAINAIEKHMISKHKEIYAKMIEDIIKVIGK